MMSTNANLPLYHPPAAEGLPECFIANHRPGREVLVAVHGISRNAAEIAMRFAAHPAFARQTIIAPLFTKRRFGQYQQLATRKPDQTRADVALNALLDALGPELQCDTTRIRLFGFSGGAQMVHRFAMLHPQRVAGLCVVSAGWYCLPRTDLAWPYGIGDGKGNALVGPQFLAIPTAVIVGNRDTRVDASVRQDPEIVEHQGRNRLRRARCYIRAVEAYAASLGQASCHRLLTLSEMPHDFTRCVNEGGLVEIVAQNLL